jgi:hypothetical protein
MKDQLVRVAGVWLVLLVFYFGFVHYTEPTQVAIVWNRFSGTISLDDKAGFNLSPPWVRVSRVDIRPSRVCVESTGRAYNCKLVQFEPKAYREFVLVQGFQYYWLNNRLSYNSGYQEEYRGMKDLLRGYAYSSKKYPFVRVLKEYHDQ